MGDQFQQWFIAYSGKTFISACWDLVICVIQTTFIVVALVEALGGGGGYFHVLIAIVVIVGIIVSHGKGHHPASRTDVNFALVNG